MTKTQNAKSKDSMKPTMRTKLLKYENGDSWTKLCERFWNPKKITVSVSVSVSHKSSEKEGILIAL